MTAGGVVLATIGGPAVETSVGKGSATGGAFGTGTGGGGGGGIIAGPEVGIGSALGTSSGT
jgi:hypothetical protein